MDAWILGLLKQGDWGKYLLMFIQLLSVVILTGLIGFEREYHGHAAGLRTHVLVGIGSGLIMMISVFGFPSEFNGTTFNRDPARLAAQVVSGIGFLGAGTIMQTGTDIKGLTTAATLWLAAAIGLACGCGYFFGALLTTVISLSVLILLRHIEKITSHKAPKIIMIVPGDSPVLRDVLLLADKYGISVRDITSNLIKYRQADCLRIVISLSLASHNSVSAFGDEIRETLTPYEIKISRR